mmetsp:Transcript_21416/g.49861  ORF Transcript_21416/g.49861 Transcript_21416/m.49861 type:complete len:585 (-) Transcript_21416:170-1924(-)
MEFGNLGWSNPLCAESSSGFGGVPRDAPKDDIWGHPKGDQGAPGLQPARQGRLPNPYEQQFGTNPYQQQFAKQEPDPFQQPAREHEGGCVAPQLVKEGAAPQKQELTTFQSQFGRQDAQPAQLPFAKQELTEFQAQFGKQDAPAVQQPHFTSFQAQFAKQDVQPTMQPQFAKPELTSFQSQFGRQEAQPPPLQFGKQPVPGFQPSSTRQATQPYPASFARPEEKLDSLSFQPGMRSTPEQTLPSQAPPVQPTAPGQVPLDFRNTFGQPSPAATRPEFAPPPSQGQGQFPPQTRPAHAAPDPFGMPAAQPFAQPGMAEPQFFQPGPGGPGGPPVQPQETRPCACGQLASLCTVRKEGPNTGRSFWKCSNCGSFEWADEPPRPPGAGPQQPSAPPMQDGPPCLCGQPSLGLTVRKDGPNQGRIFFKCANQQAPCGYFQWADEAPPPPGPPCLCGVASSGRKVAKEGQNKGRPFFVCGRRACDFFAWGDEEPGGKGSLPTPARAPPRGGGDLGGPSAGGDVCFNCNQPGHWASNCPNKAQGSAPKRGRGGGRGRGRGRGKKFLHAQESGEFEDFGGFPDQSARFAPF